MSQDSYHAKQRNFIERTIGVFKVVMATWSCMRSVVVVRKANAPDADEEVLKLKSKWAQAMLDIIGMELEVIGKASTQPTLFVANHMSYIDVPVMMKLINASFVAKAEVKKWPVFGAGADSIRTIFVERSNADSRKNVGEKIGDFISKEKRSVIIFPEGTSSSHGKPWKKGSFQIAKNFHLPVQAARIVYKPLRVCCYINRDSFIPHLWRLMGPRKLKATIEFFEPVYMNNLEIDMAKLEKRVGDAVRTKLSEWGEPLEAF